MVAIGLVAAVAVLTLAVPSPGQDRPRPPGIVGEDNRVPINSKEWPWSAIGRVNRATGGFCTGVLIARNPDLVFPVAVSCRRYFTDIDTPADLSELEQG